MIQLFAKVVLAAESTIRKAGAAVGIFAVQADDRLETLAGEIVCSAGTAGAVGIGNDGIGYTLLRAAGSGYRYSTAPAKLPFIIMGTTAGSLTALGTVTRQKRTAIAIVMVRSTSFFRCRACRSQLPLFMEITYLPPSSSAQCFLLHWSGI